MCVCRVLSEAFCDRVELIVGFIHCTRAVCTVVFWVICTGASIHNIGGFGGMGADSSGLTHDTSLELTC